MARRIIDGMESCLGGVNFGSHPSIIQPDQLAWGWNVTLRQGFPRTRPRFVRRLLVFSNIEVEWWLRTHRVQCATIFRSPQGNLIVVSVSGRLFAIDAQFSVTEITPQRASTTTDNFTVPAIGSTVDVSVSTSEGMSAGYPVIISGATYQIELVNNFV